MALQEFFASKIRELSAATWDRFVRAIDSDIAALKEKASAQDQLAERLEARGLAVIEELVSPVAATAADRVADIDTLIVGGTNNINGFVSSGQSQIDTFVAGANTQINGIVTTAQTASNSVAASASSISTYLAQLQSQGLSADLIIESTTRAFVTPSQKTAYDGYSATITANTNALALKAPIASPTFTGVPAAPTPSAGTNTTQLATTAFVRGEVAALVNSAPTALDTLKELSDALGGDASFSATVSASLGNRLRVDTNTQALTSTQQGYALTNLGFSTLGKTLAAVADAAALRTSAGLGTSATIDVGTTASKIVQLDGTAKLPAVDGSALTGLNLSGVLVAVNVYSSSQTITIPAGATKALVKLSGAGGGGQGVVNGGGSLTGSGGNGGNAGGGLIKYLTGLTPGSTLTYTQGAAGAGGTSGSTTGGAAGTTTLASGTQTISSLSCSGGGASNGSTTGSGSGGDLNVSGQRGSFVSGSGGALAGVTPGFFTRGGNGANDAAYGASGEAGMSGSLLIHWFK